MCSSRYFCQIAALFILAILLLTGLVYADPGANSAIVLLNKNASLDKFLQKNNARVVRFLGNGSTPYLDDGIALQIAPTDGTPLDDFVKRCDEDGDVKIVEPNAQVRLHEGIPGQNAKLAQSTVALLNQSTVSLLNTNSINYFGTWLRLSMVNQPALVLIRNDAAHQFSTGLGIVVADIDNGVDPYSSVLGQSLVPGYNFVDNSGDVSEWTGLDQSTVALLNQNQSLGLDQSTVALLNQSTVSLLNQSTVSLLNQSTVSLLNQSTVSLLNQSTVSLLNQSTVALLNQSTVGLLNQSTVALLNQSTVALLNQSTVGLLNQLPPAFGHGTMVLGLIHVVAPDARLMPLKAFNADGTGSLFDVIRAIVYAVNQGADVINMSLCFDQDSTLLRKAIDFAHSRGVVLVASMGNDGVETSDVFPAGYPNVLGIAATDNLDILAPFSNYGNDVAYTAPGVNLVTIFPGGHYALVSGTSFASALVSGLTGLGYSIGNPTSGNINSALDGAAVSLDNLNPAYLKKLGKGRIDGAGTLAKLAK